MGMSNVAFGSNSLSQNYRRKRAAIPCVLRAACFSLLQFGVTCHVDSLDSNVTIINLADIQSAWGRLRHMAMQGGPHPFNVAGQWSASLSNKDRQVRDRQVRDRQVRDFDGLRYKDMGGLGGMQYFRLVDAARIEETRKRGDQCHKTEIKKK